MLLDGAVANASLSGLGFDIEGAAHYLSCPISGIGGAGVRTCGVGEGKRISIGSPFFVVLFGFHSLGSGGKGFFQSAVRNIFIAIAVFCYL